jgi:hypothetical protein
LDDRFAALSFDRAKSAERIVNADEIGVTVERTPQCKVARQRAVRYCGAGLLPEGTPKECRLLLNPTTADSRVFQI